MSLYNNLAQQHILECKESEVFIVDRIVTFECLVEVRKCSLKIFLVSSMKNAWLQIQRGLNKEKNMHKANSYLHFWMHIYSICCCAGSCKRRSSSANISKMVKCLALFKFNLHKDVLVIQFLQLTNQIRGWNKITTLRHQLYNYKCSKNLPRGIDCVKRFRSLKRRIKRASRVWRKNVRFCSVAHWMHSLTSSTWIRLRKYAVEKIP